MKRLLFVAKDIYSTVQIIANSSNVLSITYTKTRYVESSLKNVLLGSTQTFEPIDPVGFDNLRFFALMNITQILVRFGIVYQTDMTCEPTMVPDQYMDIT